MRKKQALRWIALACVSVMLAGCSDQGIGRSVTPSESIASEITRQEEGKDEAQALQGQENDEARTQESGAGESETEGPEVMEDVALEKITVDPMELKNHYEKAAFFADWAYVKNPDNTIVSPMSLNMALGLAAAGASGNTAAEMYQYLGRENFEAYAKEYMDFADGLAADQDSSKFREGYSFHYEIANSIWINQRNQILEDYRKKMEECFHAEVRPGDFGVNAPETVEKINDWCSEKTHGMIPKILSNTDLSDEDKAVLINSLYFESPWVNKWALAEEDFTDFGIYIQDVIENDVRAMLEDSAKNAVTSLGIDVSANPDAIDNVVAEIMKADSRDSMPDPTEDKIYQEVLSYYGHYTIEPDSSGNLNFVWHSGSVENFSGPKNELLSDVIGGVTNNTVGSYGYGHRPADDKLANTYTYWYYYDEKGNPHPTGAQSNEFLAEYFSYCITGSQDQLTNVSGVFSNSTQFADEMFEEMVK